MDTKLKPSDHSSNKNMQPPSIFPRTMAAHSCPHSKRGQAVVEFCVGIVCMLIVIGGILQLGKMGIARTDARVQATARATSRSMMSQDEAGGLSLPPYLRRISEGGDSYSYSEDDVKIGGDEQALYDRVARKMHPDSVGLYAPGSDVAGMSDPTEMMLGMGLVQGLGYELNIPVLPIVRKLIMDDNSVDIQVQVWMTRTGEMY